MGKSAATKSYVIATCGILFKSAVTKSNIFYTARIISKCPNPSHNISITIFNTSTPTPTRRSGVC